MAIFGCLPPLNTTISSLLDQKYFCILFLIQLIIVPLCFLFELRVWTSVRPPSKCTGISYMMIAESPQKALQHLNLKYWVIYNWGKLLKQPAHSQDMPLSIQVLSSMQMVCCCQVYFSCWCSSGSSH